MRSRHDLRRVNSWMGHANLFARAIRQWSSATPIRRIAEIGAGDGTFMLRVAELRRTPGLEIEVSLIDLQDLVGPKTDAQFQKLGWKVSAVQSDVFDWLNRNEDGEFDLIIANLFLHHFDDSQLRRLLGLIVKRTRFFASCEPRRCSLALAGANLLWFIGCNSVTLHDAALSVRAGFIGREITNLWPDNESWNVHEAEAGFFSHTFLCERV